MRELHGCGCEICYGILPRELAASRAAILDQVDNLLAGTKGLTKYDDEALDRVRVLAASADWGALQEHANKVATETGMWHLLGHPNPPPDWPKNITKDNCNICVAFRKEMVEHVNAATLALRQQCGGMEMEITELREEEAEHDAKLLEPFEGLLQKHKQILADDCYIVGHAANKHIVNMFQDIAAAIKAAKES